MPFLPAQPQLGEAQQIRFGQRLSGFCGSNPLGPDVLRGVRPLKVPTPEQYVVRGVVLGG